MPPARPLICHPATPCTVAPALTVTLEPLADHWRLRYELTGDITRLRLPQPNPYATFTDGLWRHSCFELFVGSAGDAAYREFNFSPSGDWAVYAFSADRVRAEVAPTLPAPRIACERQPHALTLQAWVPVAALLRHGGADHMIGLTAVIEASDGSLSYWALHHPAPQPDFHHRAGWTARLPAFR